MDHDKISAIIDSKINGQNKQMVDQIRDYGATEFFVDLESYIEETEFVNMSLYADIGVRYHRIVHPGQLI